MKTPLYKAVCEYREKNKARMHMPGHKGNLPLFLKDAASYDITEVVGADSLYECDGAILETEQEYSKLYNTAGSFISAGGSTLCIQAMLAMVAKPNGTIICGRNIHISAVNAMSLLGLEPYWVYPDGSSGEGIPGRISSTAIKEAISLAENVVGVYITSPDYFGVISNISEIKAVCKEFDLPLIVDNAHGSCLHFLEKSLHPIALGADMCCDSLHKTMPVLTGGAILHIAEEKFLPKAKAAMSLFGSTSPSYLIMLSVDMNIEYIKDKVKPHTEKLVQWVEAQKELAIKAGFTLPFGIIDPTRLALGYNSLGYNKEEFLSILDKYEIEQEYLSENYCVFLPSMLNTQEELNKVTNFLVEIKAKEDNCYFKMATPLFHQGEKKIPLRDAVFAEKELISIENSIGRISAQVISRCPPGIPITIPGEEIDEKVKNLLNIYGIFNIYVVKYI